LANDIETLRRAYDRENDSRNRGRLWAAFNVGATRADINRLVAEELIAQSHQSARIGRYDYSPALYRLTEKGRSLVFATTMEREFERVPAADILEAMSLIVGFDDIKQAISQAIETRRRINFLLEGPPASIHGSTEVWITDQDGPRSAPVASLIGKRNFRALAAHPKSLKTNWYPADAQKPTHATEPISIDVCSLGK